MKLTRFAKLSLTGVEPMLPVGPLLMSFCEEDEKEAGFGVDEPEAGGVGRKVG